MEFGFRLASRLVGFCVLLAATALAVPATSLPFTDNFADRGEITGAVGKGTISNQGATREVDEPRHANSRTQATIWVSWVAPSDGVMSLSSRSSDFRTVIGVYANPDALQNPGLPTTLSTYGLTQLSEVAASSGVNTDRQASQTVENLFDVAIEQTGAAYRRESDWIATTSVSNLSVVQFS